jgi:hypothetical protein
VLDLALDHRLPDPFKTIQLDALHKMLSNRLGEALN